MPRPTIESDRLILQRLTRRDVSTYDEATRVSLPELNQWLPWARLDYETADTSAFIRESIQAWKEERAWDYSIRLNDDPDRHIGSISLWTVSKLGKIAEFGYWVRSDEQSRGICTEAVEMLLEEAFTSMKYHKVTLRIAVGNVASERVAEKVGFTKEGILREELLIRGNWVDHSLWSLLDREHRAMKRGGARSTK
ncbi:MAG: GNAT family protein [Acidimicrobiia bacterium]